ncbi:hypothetical protein SKAU_G00331670 [Synaphobranchus kaupii]|uniref:Uncharacterized protein n=1 Tax=Synaphobranchus kaupii TaxID=118154 RepID=A0A9Q1IIJ5_SYNKA|nr:hypothetical protein SKAU_G00331670 [Synaphobranchus kaupii]
MAERVQQPPAKRLCCRPGYNPACRQGTEGRRNSMWWSRDYPGGIRQNPESGVAAGHRGKEGSREVAVSKGGGAFRKDSRARPKEDRVLVFPQERAGDLHVFFLQHRRRGNLQIAFANMSSDQHDQERVPGIVSTATPA